MRSAVFIRDPDDPTFHPVRDVLERNISTQLWKISFSAMVYGMLILACLGGVVWGIGASTTVFPIQWSSSEPVLEFPIDVLFYNFLMPVAVKYCKPANGLTKVYDWWFHKCARWLRLTHFLFHEDLYDERWTYTWRPCNSWRRRMYSRLMRIPEEKEWAFESDGKWVQAPFSDQLRIPKGHPTFFHVDKENNPINLNEASILFLQQHSESFTKVYIPAWFRVRIAGLIFLLWMFAATTGLSVTVAPLLLGRLILSTFTPNGTRVNDIYALSIGVYLLGGVLYAGLKLNGLREGFDWKSAPHQSLIQSFICKAKEVSLRGLGLLYTYSAFTIFLPGLISLLVECYLIIPLHTFLTAHAPATDGAATDDSSLLPSPTLTITGSVLPRPMVHLIQDWTLGILYVKVAGRLILWSTPSRPANALRAIIRDGWLKPDIWLATRGFILPSAAVLTVLLTFPLALGWISVHTIFSTHASEDAFFRACIYRYSYPAVLATALTIALVMLLAKAFGRWRKRVRDEVYLIGERLHNYGDAKRKKEMLDVKGKGRERVERPVIERTHTA